MAIVTRPKAEIREQNHKDNYFPFKSHLGGVVVMGTRNPAHIIKFENKYNFLFWKKYNIT